MDDGEDIFTAEEVTIGVVPKKEEDLLPITFVVAGRVQGQLFRIPLVGLMDSGSTTTWINKKCLPPGIHGDTVEKITGSTIAGTFESSERVCLQDICLPECSSNKKMPKLSARVIHADCRYDIIVGRDMLRAFGVVLDFEDMAMSSGDVSIPMREFPQVSPEFPLVIDHLLHDYLCREWDDDEDLLFSEDPIDEDTFQAEIKDAKYDDMSPEAIAATQKHLTADQRRDLEELLSKFPTLFNGQLKAFAGETIHLEVDPTVTPSRSRAYSVPHTQLKTFKKELDHLVSQGVLEKGGRADWVSGTFLIAKKDGRVRWVSDFRALNKAIKRKFYPLPVISEVLRRRRGYKFLTKLDISMQYYTFVLDDESAELCTIATPFGLYRYRRLPMGVNASPDIAQEIMERLLMGIVEDIEVYIDDIAAFADDWKSHLVQLEKLLTILQDNGFTINPLKCEWGVRETDFLGHWLTPSGIKPWKKKIDAILRMEAPTNLKELRSFLGMVTYYRDMWPRRSHILAPLTALTKTKNFVWGEAQNRAFHEMRALLATDAILVYPDHNKPFEVESDASDYQLGAVIKQEGRPVAFYSRKLNSAQKNYTTIEKELLSVVETLRTFRSMLLGAKIKVYTDHKNLTHTLSSFTTQRVMRWRLLLEEFGPEFAYKKGSENVVADALSRVPTKDETVTPAMPETRCVKVDDLWTECLWAMPKLDERNRHPFSFEVLAKFQAKDLEVMAMPDVFPAEFGRQKCDDVDLVVKHRDDAHPLIVLSHEMLPKVVKWYHEVTMHSEGMVKLEATVRRHFWHPKIRDEVTQQLTRCDTCKTMKKGAPRDGQLAPRDVPFTPWSEVHCDLIGPWEYKVKGIKKPIKLRALTMIDPVTNLVEIVRVGGTTSKENTSAFERTWLCRYPVPRKVVSDNGPEFSGAEWEFKLMDYGIERGRVSAWTPTANAVIESVHRTMGQILRTLLSTERPATPAEMDVAVDEALARTMRACRCAANTSLQGWAPGAIVFGRDMHLNIPVIADIISISENRQLQTDRRLMRENSRRTRYEYKVGDKVYVYDQYSSSEKLKPVWKGPYPIIIVHTNGTVTVQRGRIQERMSIRRIKLER